MAALIRQRLKRQSRRYLASAAVLLIAVSIGGFSGWKAREMTILSAAQPMGDAMQAYRLFAQQGMLPADYQVGSDGDMQAWLDRYFTQANRLPDLSRAGFSPVSGRLLSTEQGPAAMVVYEDRGGNKISFYLRPRGRGTSCCHGAVALTVSCRPSTGRAVGTTTRWSARMIRKRRGCCGRP